MRPHAIQARGWAAAGLIPSALFIPPMRLGWRKISGTNHANRLSRVFRISLILRGFVVRCLLLGPMAPVHVLERPRLFAVHTRGAGLGFAPPARGKLCYAIVIWEQKLAPNVLSPKGQASGERAALAGQN